MIIVLAIVCELCAERSATIVADSGLHLCSMCAKEMKRSRNAKRVDSIPVGCHSIVWHSAAFMRVGFFVQMVVKTVRSLSVVRITSRTMSSVGVVAVRVGYCGIGSVTTSGALLLLKVVLTF